MAKIHVNKDVTTLANGDYVGTIDKAVLCNSGKVMLKIAIEDGTFFVSFHSADDFGKYPFNYLFMAVDSDELDDLAGLKIEFVIQNNQSKKTGATFSNIRKIKVIE